MPEKAVFYRRLPHEGHPPNPRIRTIWTSRMDSIYQHHDPAVTKSCVELTGDFDGEDSSEVWCDGLTAKRPGPTGRGLRPDRPDYSWPAWVNKVNSYPMFRKMR